MVYIVELLALFYTGMVSKALGLKGKADIWFHDLFPNDSFVWGAPLNRN